ncbi:MAG: hypothetical protein V9G19_18140 [Tetrasphaera sp.]
MSESPAMVEPPAGDPAVEAALATLLASTADDSDAVLGAAETLHRTLGERLRDLDG